MKRIIYLLLVFSMLLAGCTSTASPTSSDLALPNPTQTATTQPTDTPEPTPTLIPTLAPSNTFQPSPTVAPSATPSPAPTLALCTNKAEFVRHLSVSENTRLLPGFYFAKVWRIRNIGTCTWTNDYAVIFDRGDDFGSPPSSALPREVAPGDTIDIQVALRTPLDPNTYSGNWLLSDGAGNHFGVGDTGMQPLSAIVVVVPLNVSKRKETLACG
jgi:hypothetical protein